MSQDNAPRPIFRCSACDSDWNAELSQTATESKQFNDLRRTVVGVLPLLQGSGKSRVAGMLTVRNLLMHDPDADLRRLGGSALGDFCLNSLRSSVRELRIAAG